MRGVTSEQAPPLRASIEGVYEASLPSRSLRYDMILLVLSSLEGQWLDAIPHEQGAQVTFTWGPKFGTPKMEVRTALTPTYLAALREAAR